ncbi:nucleoprotein TPR-like [Panicum virgatum]|uniref:Uncharacterized protein n=1 Tax=Panicum virgatum TaxID=38727 RepID=A0A8T0XFF8_PANVG|nr:nucleoprotein TPR-like [Panicum virgatum]KAG2658790.1 hypothetical protein PVAP13_1KG309100 [Panicum virgatum]
MGEKHAADAAAADQDDGQAGAAALDGVQYCSEHPYRPGSAAAAAAVAGGGICAFCLQEKLGRLVSSSKSSPFFPLGGHPPPSGSPSSPPSFRRAPEPPPPLRPPAAASRKFMAFHRKKTPSSSSSSSSASAALSAGGGGLKRSKSVAPRPEEQFPYSSASSLAAESPRKKSFWSFLYLSSSSAYAHQAAAPYAAGAAERRKSVSVASAAWASRANAGAQDQQPRGGAAASATLGRTLEAIGEPESPSQSQVSSSSSFGRKVARSRSVGCGSRSFSGDFLERLSNGFGDCTLRRVESHREPKSHKMRGGGGALGHLGGAGADDDDDEDDDVYAHQHRIKCAGFFGGLGPASSSYWLSAAEGATGGAGSGARKPGGRSHRSWAWALASPMRALRPTTSATSTKTITVVPPSHVTSNGATSASALSISSPTPPSSEAPAPAAAAPMATETAAN